MSKIFSFLVAICIVITISSCSKSSTPDPITVLKNNLCGGNTKTWKFGKFILNGTEQTLNAAELAYTKTYKSDGTWLDSDGYTGTFNIGSSVLLKEITTNSNPPNSTTDFVINSISSNLIDVEYTVNSQTYEYVYVPK
jgi:hypothetical protein